MNPVAISIGDDVDLGERRGMIHTAFNHVVNCNINGKLVSIVTPGIGSGPNNIVVDSADLTFLTSHKDRGCDLDVIDFGSARVFDSRVVMGEFDSDGFLTNLHLLEQIVAQRIASLRNHRERVSHCITKDHSEIV